jgi:hypothetical protein
MTVHDLLATPVSGEVELQRLVNAFVDEFRSAAEARRQAMIAEGPQRPGKREGLAAAVVSALCREVGMDAPAWVREIYSPQPFFAFPARGFALRLRLMLESPPPFRARNVFVPENYLSRA